MAAATSRRLYLITAAAIAVMTTGCAAWRYLNGHFLSEETLRLYSFVTTILVVTWLVTDPKIPAVHRPSFDHGALVWATFPLLAAYHMFAAHRWRGILIVLGLLALLTAPIVTPALIYAVG
jgi:hypothetical protein